MDRDDAIDWRAIAEQRALVWDNFRDAILWMRDQDPQLVDAAIEKFGLKF